MKTQEKGNSLSERLEHVSKLLDKNLFTISEEIDISSGGLYRIASGKTTDPNSSFFQKMEETYGISSRWLLLGKGPVFVADIDRVGETAIDSARELAEKVREKDEAIRRQEEDLRNMRILTVLLREKAGMVDFNYVSKLARVTAINHRRSARRVVRDAHTLAHMFG